MQISIKPPTFMWFLPKSPIHLTEENPGPVDINFIELSKDTQKLIILGIQKNQIICSEELGSLQAFYSGKQVTIETPIRANMDEDNPHIVVAEHELKRMASERLNQTVNHIKKFITSCNDIRLLRVMLELESDTRVRKNIIENINDQLTSLSLVVQNSISHTKGSTIKSQDPIADAYNITEVIERVVEVPKE